MISFNSLSAIFSFANARVQSIARSSAPRHCRRCYTLVTHAPAEPILRVALDRSERTLYGGETSMDRLAIHSGIIDTEYFWYGGALDVPKIFDADTKHFADRPLRGNGSRAHLYPDTPAVTVEEFDLADAGWFTKLTHRA